MIRHPWRTSPLHGQAATQDQNQRQVRPLRHETAGAEKHQPAPESSSAATAPVHDAAFDPIPSPAPVHETPGATLLAGASDPGSALPPAGPKSGNINTEPTGSSPGEASLLPAPEPVATAPSLPGETPAPSSSTAISALPNATPGSVAKETGGIADESNANHAKEARPAQGTGDNVLTKAVGQAPTTDVTKVKEENPPALPSTAQDPPAPPEFESAAGPVPATSAPQSDSHEPTSKDPSHADAPNLTAAAAAATAGALVATGDGAQDGRPATQKEAPASAGEAVQSLSDGPSSRMNAQEKAGQPDDAAPPSAARSEPTAQIPGSPEPAPPAREAEKRATGSGPVDSQSTAPKRREPAEGWVTIPNSGDVVSDDKADVGSHPNSAELTSGSESAATRNPRAHAAKAMSFEPESNGAAVRPSAAIDQAPAVAGVAAGVDAAASPRARNGSDTARVESVPHVVKAGENFWTISGTYFGSGRYFRAPLEGQFGQVP